MDIFVLGNRISFFVLQKGAAGNMRIAKTLQKIEKEGKTFRLMTDAVEIRLLFMTDDILRIRAGFDGIPADGSSVTGSFEEASYTLAMTAWKDRMDEVVKDYRTRIEPSDGRIIEDREEKKKILATLDGALGYPDSDIENVSLIQGNKLTIVVFHDPFMLKVYDHDGFKLHEDVPYMGWQEDANQRRIHASVMNSEDHFYGFGERTGELDKRETLMQLAPGDSMGYNPKKTDPLYKHIPFYIRLDGKSKKAAGYFYHNTYESEFNMGRAHSNYVKHHSTYRTDGGDIDLFLIAGPSMADIIRRYTDLTGKSVMLPKGALGYLGSSMYYPELPKDADDAIVDFIDTTKKEDVPVDGFQLSSGYCEIQTKEGLKRCTFTWNKDKFKDPQKFFAEMKKRGVTVSPNIKPGMLLVHPLHKEMADKGMFVTDEKTGKPAVGLWWGGLGSYIDFTKQSARDAWKEYMKKALIDYGCDSIWNDNCEYDGLTDKEAKVFFEGKENGATIGETKAVMSNLMCQMSQEAIHEKDPDHRAFVVCRSGHAGIQRYAQVWAGDNYTSWDSLKYNIATILGMSVSGVANQGCDIGGFYGPAPEEELFVRWVQNGIFQPRFSIHSTNTDNTVTEPWMYSGSKKLIRDAIHFRYQLFPYLYSLMERAHETGLPIMAPLIYAFQSDPNVTNEGIQFMEGDHLLVANVVDKGAHTKTVYFPNSGNRKFYDFFTRMPYEAGSTETFDVDLNSIPLFLHEGAIVPLASNELNNLTSEKVTGLKILLVPDFTGLENGETGEDAWGNALKPGESRFALYEDDGTTMEYEKGDYRRTMIDMQAGENTVIRFTSTGSYESSVKEMYLDLVHREKAPYHVSVDGKQIPHYLHRRDFEESTCGWYYSQTLKSVQIRYPQINQDYEVVVSFENLDLLGM
jgi:alpha-glucosidase